MKRHDEIYKANTARFVENIFNYNEIDQITAKFKKNRINFIKYGNSFNSIDTSGNISHACLELSLDGKYFNVYIKKFNN